MSRLINIGFGNMAAAARVMAIISPESAPVKRMIQDSRDKGDLIDGHLRQKDESRPHHGQRADHSFRRTAGNDFSQTDE